MIRDNNELHVTQQRIAYFLRLLEQLRTTSRPDEFPLVAGGYRAEMEHMQRDMLAYLTRDTAQPTAEAACVK